MFRPALLDRPGKLKAIPAAPLYPGLKKEILPIPSPHTHTQTFLTPTGSPLCICSCQPFCECAAKKKKKKKKALVLSYVLRYELELEQEVGELLLLPPPLQLNARGNENVFFFTAVPRVVTGKYRHAGMLPVGDPVLIIHPRFAPDARQFVTAARRVHSGVGSQAPRLKRINMEKRA